MVGMLSHQLRDYWIIFNLEYFKHDSCFLIYKYVRIKPRKILMFGIISKT